MPSFSTDIKRMSNGSLRAVVPVLIGDASKVPVNASKDNQPNMNISSELVNGLIDTGASMTCVTSNCAERLELTPCGSREMMTASHRVKVNSYRIVVIIAIPGQATPVTTCH